MRSPSSYFTTSSVMPRREHDDFEPSQRLAKRKSWIAVMSILPSGYEKFNICQIMRVLKHDNSVRRAFHPTKAKVRDSHQHLPLQQLASSSHATSSHSSFHTLYDGVYLAPAMARNFSCSEECIHSVQVGICLRSTSAITNADGCPRRRHRHIRCSRRA